MPWKDPARNRAAAAASSRARWLRLAAERRCICGSPSADGRIVYCAECLRAKQLKQRERLGRDS